MIERLDDGPSAQPCRHPDHELPTHISLPPGLYQHTCPGCGARTTFRVDAPGMQEPPADVEPPEPAADDQPSEAPPPRMQTALGVLEQFHAFGFGHMGELIPIPLKADEARLRSSAIEVLRNYLTGEIDG